MPHQNESYVTPVRIDRGDSQVKDPSELKIDSTYKLHRINGREHSVPIIIKELMLENEPKAAVVEAHYSDEKISTYPLRLDDAGVLPYPDGQFHATIWIEKPTDGEL